MEEGAKDAFANGVPSGFPFHDLNVKVIDVQYTSGNSPSTYRNIVSQVSSVMHNNNS